MQVLILYIKLEKGSENMNKNIAAFFDIDGTLYRNALMIEHFKKLIKYEFIDPVIWHKEIKHIYKDWEKRYGDFEDYLELLAGIYKEELKGENIDYIDFVASQVISVNGDMVYKYSRDRINWHMEEGHKVFFISGGPDFLVEKMAAKYGVKEYRASEYIIDEDNKFTGEVYPMWDYVNKQQALDEFVEKYKIDLKNSYAYGDTTGDLSMLRMVGNPIAVNPNKKLLLTIKEEENLSEKTSIIIERKDVIYKLNSRVDILE